MTVFQKTITLKSHEIQGCGESLLHILEAIRATLEDSPPELSGDIVDRGGDLNWRRRFVNGFKNGSHRRLSVSVSYAAIHLNLSQSEQVVH
ncbi:rod shape-determining protein [Bacillus pumilus]|nr:rod shape-determining protein [Bacillus pumilus]